MNEQNASLVDSSTDDEPETSEDELDDVQKVSHRAKRGAGLSR